MWSNQRSMRTRRRNKLRGLFRLGAITRSTKASRAASPRRPAALPWCRRALNDIVGGRATRYDAVLVELRDHPLRLRPDVMSADLIHFTMSGHAVLDHENGARTTPAAAIERARALIPGTGPRTSLTCSDAAQWSFLDVCDRRGRHLLGVCNRRAGYLIGVRKRRIP